MSEENEQGGADLAVKVAGQEFNVKNVKSLNTLVCIAILIIVSVTAVYGYTHVVDTKEGSKELVQALKEMTQAAREQNCLISMPIDRRDPELCRRIAR